MSNCVFYPLICGNKFNCYNIFFCISYWLMLLPVMIIYWFTFGLLQCPFLCGDLCVRQPRLHLRITCRWVLLGLLAAARCCQFLTEQPRSSLMPLMAYVRFAALVIRPMCWSMVSLWGAQGCDLYFHWLHAVHSYIVYFHGGGWWL